MSISATHAAIMAIALCAIPAAGPAFADPQPPKPVAAEAPAPAAPDADTRRICSVGPVTGSLLPRKVCHTRAEWQALGLDPLAQRR